MDGDGQWLQKCPLFVGNGIGEAVSPVLRNNEIRGKTSLAGAVLITDVLTEMIFSAKAEIAFSAGDHWFNRYPVSHGDPGHGLTDFDHLTRNFVADGHGQGGQRVFPFKQVEVPAADAGGLDSEQDIMGPKWGERSFFELYPPRRGNDGHGIFVHNLIPYLGDSGI
jgi:hypothetical protein